MSFFFLSRCKPRTWLIKPFIQRMHLLPAQKLASTFSYSVYKTILIYLGIGPPRTRWCSQPLLHTDGPTLYPVDVGMKWHVPCLLSALPGQGEGCLFPLPPPPFRFSQPTFILNLLSMDHCAAECWGCDSWVKRIELFLFIWSALRVLSHKTISSNNWISCGGGRLYVCPNSPLSKFLSSFYIWRK